MADVNDIVCLGFGSWSNINTLPTLGFGISTAVVVSGPYRVAAGDVFIAGQVAGQAFIPGHVAGDVFVAGQVAGQVFA